MDEIFDKNSQQFILCFEFLLKSLLDYEKFQGTSYIVNLNHNNFLTKIFLFNQDRIYFITIYI